MSEAYDDPRQRIRALVGDIKHNAEQLEIALTTDDLKRQRAFASVIELAAVELMNHMEDLSNG